MAGKVAYRDLGLKRILKNAQVLGKYAVKVGVVGEVAAEPAADPRLTLGEEAAVLHYGDRRGHIPPRPFVEEGLDENKVEIARITRVASQGILLGQASPLEGLAFIGAKLAKMIQHKVESNMAPESAIATVVKKGGFDHTLVDTGRLHDSIGYKVVQKIEVEDATASASIEGVLGSGVLDGLADFEEG